jgi:hypothetical protein
MVGVCGGVMGTVPSSQPLPHSATLPCITTPTHTCPGLPANASLFGGLAVAVPGELQGLEAAWRRFGTQPWASLVQPAASLARSGFAAHPYLVNVLSGASTLQRVMVRACGVVMGVCKLRSAAVPRCSPLGLPAHSLTTPAGNPRPPQACVRRF